MGATATLAPPMVAVDPGSEASCEVKVRNTGEVVDQFTLEVIGSAASWAAVEPPSLSLFPGAEGVARVSFRPPRSADVRAASVPFAIRVASKEDPAGSVVEEGVLDVGRFLDAFAELVPRTSRGRRSARHELALDNRGNDRLNANLAAADPDAALTFDIDPPTLAADPGAAAFARVRVRPNRRFLRGPPKSHLFTVTATAESGTLTADGTMLQEALLPKWLPKALLALLGLAVLAGLLWVFLLKPAVESAAKDAVEEPLRQQQAQVQDVQKQQAATDAKVAQIASEGGGVTPAASPSPAPTEAGLGTPTDGRLPKAAFVFTAGQTKEDFFQVPDGKSLSLTDIVFQNPNGDSGSVTVLRGSSVLLEVKLDNFRDLDYHFVTPVTFTGGQRLSMRVRCDNPAPKNCTPAVYYVGFQKDA